MGAEVFFVKFFFLTERLEDLMAKNKHEKLGASFRKMLNDIDNHSEKVAEALDLVQLYFYEKLLVKGRQLMSQKARRRMMQTHYVGMQYLAPSLAFQELCRTKPWLGTVLQNPVVLRSQIIERQTVGWFIPWGVKFVCPEENLEKLQQNREKALLYCPAAEEINKELDWFEKEDAADSLTHHILNIGAEFGEQALLRKNLCKDPNPLYKKAVKEWKQDFETAENIAESPKKLDEIDFAPKPNQSVALAFEAVLRSIRERGSRHRQNLRKRYKEKLKACIFEGLPWSEEQKNGFIFAWESRLFLKSKKPQKKKEGRWEQCQGIDRYKAAALIGYFVQKCIQDKNEKMAGEIACILWIMIRIAQEEQDVNLTLSSVIKLTTYDFIEDSSLIYIRDHPVCISKGLHRHLCCLLGEAQGDRNHPLFKNVTQKGFERALTKASAELFGENCEPVLPASFLVSPHPYKGQRISATERESMRNARQLVPFTYTRRDVLSALKHQQMPLI